MSRFIKSHEEIAAARSEARRAAKTGAGAGFTEAELEAASWARRLPEVQLQIARRTNGEKRSNTKGTEQLRGERHFPRNSLAESADAIRAQENMKVSVDPPSKKAKKDKAKKEKKEKKHEKKKKKKDAIGDHQTEDNIVATTTPDAGDAVPSNEIDMLEAKALEVKRQRKIAKQMRREQRRLKREERERFRQEEKELEAAFHADPGLQDAIDNLIEAVKNDRPCKAPGSADDALDQEQGPAPCRSLEELVAQLDELEKAGVEGGGGEKRTAMPQDPLNPLNAAYDMRAYEMLRKLRLDEEHQMSQVAADEPEWDHLGYLRRSPSPCRLRTNGTMWPTRKGAWRSRAGGVYLPPEMIDVERRGSPSLSPAKWMYPEEFNRPVREARRSPSYTRYDREEISCTSSSSSSSTVPKRRRKKQRPRSSSHETRPSPEYVLED